MNSTRKYNLSTNMVTEHNPKENTNSSETAQYIADMLLELRKLAKASELKNLQGLLELCYYEAFGAAHKAVIPEGEAERLEQMGADARKAEAS